MLGAKKATSNSKGIMMKRTGVFLAAIAMSAISAAPAIAASVYETLKSNPQFSTLTKIIEANDLKFRYTGGSITVFAPTDEALAQQPGGIDDLLTPGNPSNKENARALLLYSITSGRYTPAELQGKVTTATTLQGGKVQIDGTQTPIHYGSEKFGADVSGDAIEASNGVIIPVDRLAIPVFGEETPETHTMQ